MAAGHTNMDTHLSIVPVSFCLPVHLSFQTFVQSIHPLLPARVYLFFSLPFASLWVQSGIRALASIQANFIQPVLSQLMV